MPLDLDARQGRQPEAAATSNRFDAAGHRRRARRSAATRCEQFAPAQFQDLDDADEAVAARVRAAARRASSSSAAGARLASGRAGRSASCATRRSSSTPTTSARRGRFRRLRRGLFDALPRAAQRSPQSTLSQRSKHEAAQPFDEQDRGRATRRYVVASTATTTASAAGRGRSRARRRRATSSCGQLARPTRRWRDRCTSSRHSRRSPHERRSAPTRSCPGCARASPTRSRRRPRPGVHAARHGATSSCALTGEPVGGGTTLAQADPARRRALRAGRHRRHRPPRRSSAPSRATGSPTSSRTTCRTSSSTTRTSRGATRRPRRDAGAHRLRPWLALVVLDGGRVRATARHGPGRPLPSIDGRRRRRRCPPPTSCGRGRTCTSTAAWSRPTARSSSDRHGRACCRGSTATLAENPDLAYSRLVCPRRLAPNTAYHAFLVPTFESGRLRRASASTPPTRPARRTSAWATTRTGRGADELPVLPPLVLPHRRRSATSSTWCGCCEPQPVDQRVGTPRHGRAAPGSNLPAIDDPDLGGVLQLGGALRVPASALDAPSTPRTRTYENWDDAVSAPVPDRLAGSSTWPTTTRERRRDDAPRPDRRRSATTPIR